MVVIRSADRALVVGWLNRMAPKGGMVHGAAVLGGATLATQSLGILLSPILSRLYSPADYGLFGVYSAIVATSLTVGSFCYETGVPVGENDREAVGLTVISILLVTVISFGAIAWLGLCALLGFERSWFELGGYIWLVPVGIVGAGVFRAFRFWALRCNAMGAISRTTLSQAVASSALSLGFGILYPRPLGLILAGIAGSSLGLWGLGHRTELIPRILAERRSSVTVAGLWVLARKYKRLPLVSAPSTLLNSLGLYLPAILLVPYFGAEFAGQFFMGMKVISLPASLIGGALSQVFFSRAATVARERPKELSRLFHQVYFRAAASSLLILFLGLASIWIIPLALGRRWQLAGEISAWLSIVSALGMSVSALSYIPQIVGRLQGQFAIDAVRAVSVFLLLFLGHRLGASSMGIVKGYVVVMVLNYIACYALYRHQVRLVSATGMTGWSESKSSSIRRHP